MKSKSKVKPIEAGQVALRPAQFARACGFCRTTLYALPTDQKPKMVRVGRAVLIIESPTAYLQRLAAMQTQREAA